MNHLLTLLQGQVNVEGDVSKDKPVRRVGVLFSNTGVMSVTEEAHLKGVLVAIEEINNDPASTFVIEPIVEDPGSDPNQYKVLAKKLATVDGVSAIFGCCSSASRKAVLPILARYGTVLFYPSVYEGFEYSPNVVYGGATPNQTILPLIEYLFAHHGSRLYVVGSDYIYAREINRIVAELLDDGGGTIVGEAYVPLGSPSSAFEKVAREVTASDVDAVLSTVVGADTCLLYEAVNDASSGISIASLTTTESELATMRTEATVGHITAACYFGSLETEENRIFRSIYQQRYGASDIPSIYAQTTYSQVHAYVQACNVIGSDDPEELLEAIGGLRYVAPQGAMLVDPDNNHVYNVPRIGLSRADGEFDIVWQGEQTKPDPYLIAYDREVPTFTDA